MNLFEQTKPSRRRYYLAAFIGVIAGIVSAFVKWVAEHPLPPEALLIFLHQPVLLNH